MRIEDLRLSHSHIRYYTKPIKKSSLQYVLIPTAEGWKQTKTREEMETYVHLQKVSHFSQASGTPLCQDPGHIFRIPMQENTHYLQSDSIPNTTDDIKQFFIRHKNVAEISTEIKPEEFRTGIKKWKEKTTTSPSGRHLGHYHAQMLPNFPDERQDRQTMFSKLHTDIANLCIKHTIVLDRWKKVDTVCIEKDEGDPKIHRLRPLHMYEVDLNLIKRILLARRLSWNASQNELPDDNWGSRGNSSDLGLLKILTLEMSFLTYKTLGQIDLDAKACYDQIIRPIALLACYKYGLPLLCCSWLNMVMDLQEFHLVTGHGHSQRHYSRNTTRLHGIGQGSCEAPVMWLLISSIIFLSLRTYSPGVTWTTTARNITQTRYADAFVDDTTLWINGTTEPEALIRKMETILEKYQETLNWTGGALSLPNCFYSVTH